MSRNNKKKHLTPEQTLSILQRMETLIGDKRHWIRGALKMELDESSAITQEYGYCLLGAKTEAAKQEGVKLASYSQTMDNKTGEYTRDSVEQALYDAMGKRNKAYGNIAAYNDTHTHPQVMKVLRKAIENTKEKLNA